MFGMFKPKVKGAPNADPRKQLAEAQAKREATLARIAEMDPRRGEVLIDAGESEAVAFEAELSAARDDLARLDHVVATLARRAAEAQQAEDAAALKVRLAAFHTKHAEVSRMLAEDYPTLARGIADILELEHQVNAELLKLRAEHGAAVADMRAPRRALLDGSVPLTESGVLGDGVVLPTLRGGRLHWPAPPAPRVRSKAEEDQALHNELDTLRAEHIRLAVYLASIEGKIADIKASGGNEEAYRRTVPDADAETISRMRSNLTRMRGEMTEIEARLGLALDLAG